MITETKLKRIYPSFELAVTEDLIKDDLVNSKMIHLSRSQYVVKDYQKLINFLKEFQMLLSRLKFKSYGNIDPYVRDLNRKTILIQLSTSILRLIFPGSGCPVILLNSSLTSCLTASCSCLVISTFSLFFVFVSGSGTWVDLNLSNLLSR